jgi:hypothetical protein
VQATDLSGNIILAVQRYKVKTVTEATTNLINALAKGTLDKANKVLEKFICNVRKQLAAGPAP